MRLAVIADIHGNFRALQAVFADLESQLVDQVISLGDNIGYGPEPNEVVSLLADRGVDSVIGNHELALVSASYSRRLNPISLESLLLTNSLLSQASRTWLAELPTLIIRAGARFVHGSPPSSVTAYLFNPSAARLQRLFSTFAESYCFCGHTHTMDSFHITETGAVKHVPLSPGLLVFHPANRYLIIPGSIGQPRDNWNNKAKYSIWDGQQKTLEIRAVAYDVETTVRLLKERGFPLVNARRLQS